MPKSYRRSHRGSVLPIVLLSLVVLMGMGALAMDVSSMYGARQRAQNVADAAAMAAAEKLPTTGSATTAANSVIAANNANGVSFTMTSITYPTSVTQDDGTANTVSSDNAVTITGYVNAPMTFSPVVGYSPTSTDGVAKTLSVQASATVAITNACSFPIGSPVVPLTAVADSPTSSNATIAYISKLLTNASSPTTPTSNTYQSDDNIITLKAGQWKSGAVGSGGNCGAIDVGSGANAYRDALGSQSSQSFYVGQSLTTKPGNMAGPTRQGVETRLSSSNTSFTHYFTSYEEWFFGRSSYGVDSSMSSVSNGCHTYYYRNDPNRQDPNDAHLMIVPLISQPSKNGSASATVLAFAVFFMEEPDDDSDDDEIMGRFIGFSPPTAGGGVCVGAGALTPPRLMK